MWGGRQVTTTEITVQVTPQELRIPLAGLEAWKDAELELELVREKHAIVIRPKSVLLAERERAQQVLREAGWLYETHFVCRVDR
ncbi:MAG TPA: hypothetical protein PLH19_11900 [Anaerolineae bacterium]|nr:hypothetical protein [Anaerolineae bacterium]HQH39221.1 hypothetical protein [Anaerolineae bacterium]